MTAFLRFVDPRYPTGIQIGHIAALLIGALIAGTVVGVVGTVTVQHEILAGASAGRPGHATVPLGKKPAPTTTQGGRGAGASRFLLAGEGSGSSYCARYGGYLLGANLDGVYACGPSTGTPDKFDFSGFQCVELTARSVWVTHEIFLSGIDFGKNLVSEASAQTGIPDRQISPSWLPVPGDPVSMSGGYQADSFGHTAVVTAVHVDRAGNGTIQIMEENGIASGVDWLNVSGFHASYGTPGYPLFWYTNISFLALNHDTKPKPHTFPLRAWQHWRHVPYRTHGHLTLSAGYWLKHQVMLGAPTSGEVLHRLPHRHGFAQERFRSVKRPMRRWQVTQWLHLRYRAKVRRL